MRMPRALAGTIGASLLVSGLAVGPAVAADGNLTSGGLDAGAVTVTKTVSRTHLEADGSETKVDSRTVTLKVTQTKALHSRQPVMVSWSGARPTAGTVGDPNTPEASQQEYPFLLIECRGVDSTTAAPQDKLSPETCWTGSSRERVVTDRDTGFGPWRLDRFETAPRRQAFVDVTTPLPAKCDPSFSRGERWLHFTSARGIDYAADGASCPSVPPESVVVSNASQPANTTYAATQPNGTGSTKFTTWTSEDNASLGCGGAVKCALVAIPIMGVSCDVAAKNLPSTDRPTTGRQADTAGKRCKANGAFEAGQPRIGGTPDLAVTGSLWFSESNWRNRITVPLEFAPLNNVCDIAGSRPGVDIYGSELAAQLTAQWRPGFCLDAKRTPFKHIQIGEPQAANLLKTGSVPAAFVTNPPGDGFGKPAVMAPVSLTGFAVSYAIDDANQARYTSLRLTARLLAKLLTESYPGITPVRDEYDALSRNPLDISQVPEFIALNPGIKHGVPDSAAASTILNLSSDSDVVRAVTSYIAADPETKRWLRGAPDPWGMVINPNYNTDPQRPGHLTLPVNNWPLRDAFEPTKYYKSGVNICLQSAPAPILPLIAVPTARLANIALALQFANSSPQLTCQSVQDKGADGAKLVSSGRQGPGYRFVIGLTSLGDAERYDLDTAALQTNVATTAAGKFTGDSGRVFVSPDDASLKVAAGLLTADDATGTWKFPYDAVATDPKAAKAYPGVMLVSLAAPTAGLDARTATGVSQLLTFAAGPGQTRGLNVGQVPPGFLPLTAANGLGAQQAYTVRAAAAVAAQRGVSLAPSSKEPGAAAPGRGVTTTPRTSAGPVTQPGPTGVGPHGGAGQPGDGGTTASGGVIGQPSATGPTAGSGGSPAPRGQSPKVARFANPVASVAAGITGAVSSMFGSGVFPLLALIGVIGLLTAAIINRFGRPSGPT